MPPYQPLRKIRLYELADSEASTPTSSGLNPAALPFKITTSLINLNTPEPFFEDDYPSQRFRPSAMGEKHATDPYYSPPPTFMPPESPNDISAEDSETVEGPKSQVKIAAL